MLPLRLPITGTETARGRAFEQTQVLAWAVVLAGSGRKVSQGLGEALCTCLGKTCVLLRLAVQLLFEQRIEHHRTDAGVGEAPDAVDGLRQRGCRRDQWVAQCEAHDSGSTAPSVFPAGVGVEVFGTAGSHLLVGIPALFDRLFCQPEQPFGFDRIGVGQ